MTKADVRAALSIAAIVAEAIQSLGSVPSGELYAHVMQHLSHESYEAVINTLIRADLVSRSGHVLTWIGPRKVL